MFDKFKRNIGEAINNADFCKKVTPALIEEFPDHVLIDKHTHVKCIIIGLPHMSTEGYPSNMSPLVIDRLLDLSMEGCTIAYSYTLIPIKPVEATAMLEHAEYVNVGNQRASQKNNPLGLIPMNLQLDHEDLRGNYAELHRHEQNMFHSAFIITMWAQSDDDMRRVSSHVEAILEAERILYEYPFYQMLNTFIAAQPYPITADYSWVECFSNHAAKLATTRNPNSRMDEHGLYFGIDMKTGKNVQVDLKLLAAQHLMFVGPTGSGKTFTLLMLLMRAHDMLDKRIIYTTPKEDIGTNYRAVAEYYGKSASIIDVGPRGNNINPLQILYDKSQMGDSFSYTRAYDYHKDIVGKFFSTWFEGTMSVNMDSYLDETLNAVYKGAGIHRDNPDSWDDMKWPTLADLRAIWGYDSEAKHTGSKQQTAEAMYSKTFKLGTDGSLSYMNRATDIDLSADFIIIDFSNIPEGVQDAMNVLVTGMMGMRFSTDASKETIIAIDEAAVFLRNPKLSTFLLKTLAQGRSYNIALWLATQQTVDLVKAGVNEEFKTNMQVNIVLGDNMRKDTITHVKDFFRLDTNAQDALMSCSVGEGLLIVGDESIPTKFKPTAHEMSVIKGEYLNDVKTSTACDYTIDSDVSDIAAEHGLYLDEWIKGAHTLHQNGYESKMLQRAAGRGTVKAWIDSGIINGNKVGNQSIDHYGTVIQMAGYLAQNGVGVKVNHYDDADIIAEFNGKTVGIEYERPGSHSAGELVAKKQRAENSHGRCLFVCTGENEKMLKSVAGDTGVVKRGLEFVQFVETFIGGD